MIIHTNPFEITEAIRRRTLSASFETLTATLRQVLEALDRQRAAVVRLRNHCASRSASQSVINSLVDEIDAVVDACRVNDKKLLDGSFSKINCRASMWFRTGLSMHQAERIYIQTMTSRSLSLSQNQPADRLESIANGALVKIDKAKADIQGYLSRAGFASRFIPDGREGEMAYHSIEVDIRREQIGFLQCASGNLEIIAAVLNRIKELARNAAQTSLSSEKQCLQVEVSALIDEIDRIASQASYNRYRFFNGDFSQRNPRASIWFLDSRSPDGVTRVFLGTMTTRGLGLRDYT
nr:hypothetical protein [Spirochaetota bacterium]